MIPGRALPRSIGCLIAVSAAIAAGAVVFALGVALYHAYWNA